MKNKIFAEVEGTSEKFCDGESPEIYAIAGWGLQDVSGDAGEARNLSPPLMGVPVRDVKFKLAWRGLATDFQSLGGGKLPKSTFLDDSRGLFSQH